MSFDQPVIQWSSELASSIAANKAINDVEEYQKSFVCYASRGYMCEAANLSTIRTHSPNAAPITARLDVVAAPAEYCLPIKKDRRFAPEFTVQVTLGTAAPGDVAAKVLACPFSETHRRALSTPVQQRLPQFLVNEALGKGQPASEEDRQKWYLSFKGQTSVSLHFDSQRDAVPHTGGNQIVMQKRGTFSGLEYLKSSHMERVYLLFAMTLGDSPDIIATLFTVPTIVICRASQRRLATERLGYQLSVYDDLRTRGCSYNLPSRKPGGATSPAAPPCRTAAAAAAAVAAAAVGCADTRTNSSGASGSKESGSAAAAAAVAASLTADAGAHSSAMQAANSSYAALMNGAPLAASLAGVADVGRQVNPPKAMVQSGVANMNGLGAVFDLAAQQRPNKAGQGVGECSPDPARAAQAGAHSRGSKDGGDSAEEDDEMTQDEDDAGKPSAAADPNAPGSAARSRGVKRPMHDAAAAGGSRAAVAVPAGSSKSSAEVVTAGATNLAWLRVGQPPQPPPARQDRSQAQGVQEAHNLVSKLPRLVGAADRPVATGAPASLGIPLKVEDLHGVNNSILHAPATSQPLQALLALCNSQSNKTHLTQQLAAVATGAVPAGADPKGSAPAATSSGAAAAIASALRSAAAATSLSAPAPKKASVLDIQKLYQQQPKPAAPSGGAPVPALPVAHAPPQSDAHGLAAIGHHRGNTGVPNGPAKVMLSNTRFEIAVHEEILSKNLFNPEVLAALPKGIVRLPNRFSETAVRRAIEFLYSGKTALDADNALMTLAVAAHLEAPTLVTYCFDYVLEWIQSTIGKWIDPSAAVEPSATAPLADRSSWTVNEKTADGSATAAALPVALALGGVSQGVPARPVPAAAHPAPAQQLREKPADAFERVLEQYEPSAHNGTSGSTPGAASVAASDAAAAPAAAAAVAARPASPPDAAAQMELLLRIAQGQSSNSGGDRGSVSSTSIAGLQAMLGGNHTSKPPLVGAPAAEAALQMSVSTAPIDAPGNVAGLPSASAAAAAAATAAALSVKRTSGDIGVRFAGAKPAVDGGSVPTTPEHGAKVSLSAAADGSPSQKTAAGADALGGRAAPRSPNCGASVAERRMHEQRAAEEERMRQLQLANESRELLAALLDSAQTTPEIMNNPQTVELAKHLLMAEQAARAAAGAASQMASGYANPSVVAQPPHSCA